MSSESEKLQHDTGESIKTAETSAEQAKQHEAEPTKAEKEHGHEDKIESLHAEVIEKAESAREHASNINTQEKKQHPVLINKQLKDMAYSRALTRTRKHLSLPSRLFSQVVHSKALDRSSEAVGKTIARPSSMLGGALFSLVGTSVLLWVTKKQGYEYNYLAVVVLFATGMIIGLAFESLYRLVKRRP